VSLNRRSFLGIGAAGIATAAGFRASAEQLPGSAQIKALAFDAFPVFDPRPVFLACEKAFPGHGTELGNLWRTRQFEYQWLRALGGHYQDFWQATRSALYFATRSLKLELSGAKADSLMEGYLALKTWPDVPDALSALKHSGRKLAFLSNATAAILDAGIRNSGLHGVFDQVISTDRIKTFKPDPRAYQLGVDVLGLRKEEILFVAFAGWDAAGAKWFGYPTFWNNRQRASAEELDAPPDGTGESLSDLARFLNVRLDNSA
jgi:2-haloacid dehalogenase